MYGPPGVLVHFLSKQDFEAETEENSWVGVIGFLCCQGRKRKQFLPSWDYRKEVILVASIFLCKKAHDLFSDHKAKKLGQIWLSTTQVN